MRQSVGASISALQALPFVPLGMRARLLRWFGVRCPRDVTIYDGVYFSSNRVTIGNDCFINARCFFDAGGSITLGDAVHIGPGSHLITSTHDIAGHDRRAGSLTQGHIHIDTGTWLGANVTVLPGVRIAAGCIVAAGAVVTRDCDADGIYAGVPARRIRDLPE